MKKIFICFVIFICIGTTSTTKGRNKNMRYDTLVAEIPTTQLVLDEIKRSEKLQKEYQALKRKADTVLPQLDSIDKALDDKSNLRQVKRELRREARNNKH